MTEQIVQSLRRRTNHHGLVIVREDLLLDELQMSSEALRSTIKDLEENGLLEVLSPLPFLVLKWSGKGSKSPNSTGNAYSYSKQLLNNKAIKADSYRPAELKANDGLLHEILETLGETDPQSFRMAIENYSPYVIRTALNRVRRAKSIRKNRTALFRHLLPRIARESHQIS
jgi:hypothetical protein